MEQKKRITTLDLTYMALFAALIAICSWISIPLTVPFTMQTFAVFVTVGLLGMKRGTLSIVLYILLGTVGIPVFANFSAGPGVLLGNTGGYIIGFVASSLLTGVILSKFGKKTYVMAIAMVLGLSVCYILGTAWFINYYATTSDAIGIATAISMCITPCIIPDLVKIALAILVVKRVGKYVPL